MEQRVCRWRMGHVLAVLQLLLVCRALGEHSLFPRQESAGEGSGGQCDEDGEVQLVGGEHDFEGRVQVCEDRDWTDLCILDGLEDWTANHAKVVCRSLGYSTENVLVLTEEVDDVTIRRPHTMYTCNGKEENFTQCNRSNPTSFLCNEVGKVICEVPEDNRECATMGDIRLVNGSTTSTTEGQGRVELCASVGVWGTVCDDGWGELDAAVVCRKLGFTGTDHEPIGDIIFGKGNGAILISAVNCSGTEESLFDCPHKTVTGACTHLEDASVICDNGDQTESSRPVVIISVSVGFSLPLIILLIITAGSVTVIVLYKRKAKRRKSERHLRREESAISDYVLMRAMPTPYAIPTTSAQLSSAELSVAQLPNAISNSDKWKQDLEVNLLDSSQVQLNESLGEGCFGTVYRGSYQSEAGEIIVAIKTIKSSANVNVEDFISECIVMKDFDHPNVLGLVGIYFKDSSGLPLIVLPYMANGDLRTFLHSKRDFTRDSTILEFPNNFDLPTALRMCTDICHGMEYLATNRFIHRDLAARNCMVSDNLTVKVADFGLSREIYEKDYYRVSSKSPLLPIKWMAPESLNNSIFTEKTDVWSFGVVCWEVFSLGSTPYPGVGNHEILDYITDGHRLKQPKLCPAGVFQAMESCWKMSPSERPSFEKLVHIYEFMVHNHTTDHTDPLYVNLMENSNHQQLNGTSL